MIMRQITALSVILIRLLLGSSRLMAADRFMAEPAIRPGERSRDRRQHLSPISCAVHGYLETLLLQHFRENPVSIRNLGWGGDMVDGA